MKTGSYQEPVFKKSFPSTPDVPPPCVMALMSASSITGADHRLRPSFPASSGRVPLIVSLPIETFSSKQLAAAGARQGLVQPHEHNLYSKTLSTESLPLQARSRIQSWCLIVIARPPVASVWRA